MIRPTSPGQIEALSTANSLVASGLFVAMLMAYGSAHALGWFMLIATLIPIADAMIVLHHGGSRTIAFGVHGVTAVAMLIISGLLLID